MNSMKKRIFSLFMAVVLCFSMMPTSALAKDADISAMQETLKGAQNTIDSNITESNIAEDSVVDGDTTKAGVTDGDATKGDATDGNVTDGGVTGGDVKDGDATDGDVTGGDAGTQNGKTDAAVQAVQKLIDALPAKVTAENADEIAAQLMAIDEALDKLTDEQIAQLDMTRYEALCEALTRLTAEQDGEHMHYLCDRTTCTEVGHSKEESMVTFEAWTDKTSLPESGTYYLTDDVTLRGAHVVTGELTLCLNGHTINQAYGDNVIKVVSGTFTLSDCMGTGSTYGKITHNSATGYGIYVGKDDTASADPVFKMYGGSICNNQWVGVYAKAGLFEMYDGSITGNSSEGVKVYASSDTRVTFNMYGGRISYNKPSGDGGGVYVTGDETGESSFNMYGGSLYANTADGNGGGVCVYGEDESKCSFNIYGGIISQNKAVSGGGVYVNSKGTMTVSGEVTITQNYDKNDSWKASNVYLPSSKSITIGEKGLDSSAKIGVTSAATVSTSKYVTVATGATQDYSSNFSSDTYDPRYTILWENDEVRFYNGAPQHHYLCAGKDEDGTARCTGVGGHHEEELTTFTAWSGPGLPTTSGNYYLTKDVSMKFETNEAWRPAAGSKIALCLNGKKVYLSGELGLNASYFYSIILDSGVSFTVTDCTGKGQIYHSKNSVSEWCGVKVNGGSFTMYEGTITKFDSNYGGGVYVAGGSFDMYGGTITDNDSYYGGAGVYVEGGSFNMHGGSITGNRTGTRSYGGVKVYKKGSFNVSGAPNITENTDGNVYLLSGAVINVVGALTGGTIPVMIGDLLEGDYVVIAKGTEDYQLTTTDMGYFIIDDHRDEEDYKLALVGNSIVAYNGALHDHAVCGSDNCTETGHDDVLWTPLTYDAESQTLYYGDEKVDYKVIKTDTGGYYTRYTLPAGNYYLTGSIELTGGRILYSFDFVDSKGGVLCADSGTVNLCLNGNTLSTPAPYVGPIVVRESGAFTLSDCESNGMLTSDNAVCGVWTCSSNTTFTMYGGKITGNQSGVFQTAGSVNLYGGTITGNTTAGVTGASTGALTVGGTVNITDNGSDDTTQNVKLAANKGESATITIDESLKQDAQIGITTAIVPDKTNKNVKFATGASDDSLDYTKIFIPDAKDQNYVVIKNDTDLYLNAHEHSWVYTAESATIIARCVAADCNLGQDFAVTYTIEVPADLTYSGAAKEASVKHSELPSGLTMPELPEITYSKKVGEDYLETEVTPVDVGTYKASITIEGKTASVVYSILPKEITDPVIAVADGGSYDGTAKEPAVTVKDGDAQIPSSEYTVSYENNICAGTATVNITDVAGGNYIVNGSAQFTINQASVLDPATATFTIRNGVTRSYTFTLPELPALEAPRNYGGHQYSEPQLSFSNTAYTGTATVSDDGKLSLQITGTGSTVGKIGEVTVAVTTYNYTTIHLTADLQAANQMVPQLEDELTLSPAEITYGEVLKTIRISGKMVYDGNEVPGTFTWQEPDAVLTAGTHSDVEWKFTPENTQEYAEVTGMATVKVNKAAQSGKATMSDYIYNETPGTPGILDQVGDGAVTYYYSTVNLNQNGTEWKDIQPTTLDAGIYYLYAEIAETENYTAFVTPTVPFEVEMGMPENIKIPEGLTAKYGQKLNELTLTNPSENMPGEWSWQAPSTLLDRIGIWPCYADFTPENKNYKKVVHVEVDVTVEPAEGRNLATINRKQKYTDTATYTYQPDWSSLPKGQTWNYGCEFSTSSGSTATLDKWSVDAASGKLSYAITGGQAGDVVTFLMKAQCYNYTDFTVTLNVTLTEKDEQAALTITGGTTVVYGQILKLGTKGGSGTGAVTYSVTNGTGEATIDNNGRLTPVKVGTVKVQATKAGDENYSDMTSDEVEITITKAKPTGKPKYTKITKKSKTLADAALELLGSTIKLPGQILWVAEDGVTPLDDSTIVKANKSYKWLFIPADSVNYTNLTGSVVLYRMSSDDDDDSNGAGEGGTSYTAASSCTIEATAGANGSISPAGATTIRTGGDQTYTITPDKGYAVAKVLVDGSSVGAVTTYTFQNVTRNHTIQVVFMKANGNPQTGVCVDMPEEILE